MLIARHLHDGDDDDDDDGDDDDDDDDGDDDDVDDDNTIKKINAVSSAKWLSLTCNTSILWKYEEKSKRLVNYFKIEEFRKWMMKSKKVRILFFYITAKLMINTSQTEATSCYFSEKCWTVQA